MKLTNKQKIATIISIFIVALSLVMMVLDWVLPLNLWVHPMLTFLFFMLAGFGLLFYTIAVIKHAPPYFFLGAGFTGLALLYALISSGILWYYALLCVLGLWIMTVFVDILAVGGIKTEHAENKSPEYKNYKQRIAEKEECKKNEEKEELPEIKSFKD